MKTQIEQDAEKNRLRQAQEIVDRYSKYKEEQEFEEWKSENKKIIRAFNRWVLSSSKEIMRGETTYEKFFVRLKENIIL